MDNPSSSHLLSKIQAELRELDAEPVMIDGIELKPSQCYHFDTNPAHVLFNTNCPDSLKLKVQAILGKYIQQDETRS